MHFFFLGCICYISSKTHVSLYFLTFISKSLLNTFIYYQQLSPVYFLGCMHSLYIIKNICRLAPQKSFIFFNPRGVGFNPQIPLLKKLFVKKIISNIIKNNRSRTSITFSNKFKF